MSANLQISAELRTDKGKGASRRLRHASKVPGILYGANKNPEMISMDHNSLLHAIEDEAFFSSILTLKYGDKSEKVVIKDLQRHPAKCQIMHADFLRIDETHAIHVNVPLHFVNEANAPGVKEGGKVAHLITDVEITCLPKDLPEFIEVDLSNLGEGQAIHLSDLVLPQGVTLVELMHGSDHDLSVANIHTPRGEKAAESGEEEASEE